MKAAKIILAENIRTLMSRNPHLSSQNALGKASAVGQTTIGNWLRQEYSSQRLEQVEAIARAFRIDVGKLLTENLGEKPNDDHSPNIAVSSSAQSIIDRLIELDTRNQSPPALYALIESALDLAAPTAAKGYPGLDKMQEE